jgi:hypothetical protein
MQRIISHANAVDLSARAIVSGTCPQNEEGRQVALTPARAFVLKVYFVAASAGLAAFFLAWTFLAFTGLDAATAGADATTAAGAAATTGAGFATAGADAVAGVCANDTVATPANKVAATKVLIFNMVHTHFLRDNRGSFDCHKRARIAFGLVPVTGPIALR